MPKRKTRLRKKRTTKRRRTKPWDIVTPLGAGVGASVKLSAVGKVPALLPALGAGFG